jgi:hypothetical protein
LMHIYVSLFYLGCFLSLEVRSIWSVYSRHFCHFGGDKNELTWPHHLWVKCWHSLPAKPHTGIKNIS